MQVVAFRPMVQPLDLRFGLDPRSPEFLEFLKALQPIAKANEFVIPALDILNKTRTYSDISNDDYDMRILHWQTPVEDDTDDYIRYHVFPNRLLVAEVYLKSVSLKRADDMQSDIDQRVNQLINTHDSQLKSILADCITDQTRSFLTYTPHAETIDRKHWISSAVMIPHKRRTEKAVKDFMTDWLSETARPQDADALAQGDIHHSLTWVRYIIIDMPGQDLARLLSAMRIAQYFYAAQEQINIDARNAIAAAHQAKSVSSAEKILATARSDMQLLRINFDVQYNYLNLKKRALIDQILKDWDYKRLVENCERMIEASNARIEDINHVRTSRSSFVTDIILGAITFLAIIELALGLTQYSREVMSRPALSYTDETPSFILEWIAGIDADRMIIGGFLIIILLLTFYGFWKKRN